jgi:hypothetical protein
MHAVKVLEEALQAAQQLGWAARYEWLDGSGGGACEFGGKRWLFLDLSQNVSEQLEAVIAVLDSEPPARLPPLSPILQKLMTARRAA